MKATGTDSGIRSENGSISIGGNDTVVEAKGIIGSSSIGIHAYENSIDINSGKVTASGNGYGLCSGTSNITISGGSVTAIGSYSAIYNSVKNSMPGIGWENTEGTGQQGTIPASDQPQSIDGYKKIQFKSYATVTTPPKAKTLTYSGQEQELITAGVAEHGTMKYAIGTTTGATITYSEAIPKGKDVGTYYVWYYVESNTVGYEDSTPDYVTVAINEKPAPPPTPPTPPTPKKPDAVVTKAPTANSLTYNEQAQALVTAGEADGGTMQYALGIDSTTAPKNGWSADVPTSTDAGSYFVWFKVVGDINHEDLDPSYVGMATIIENHSDNVLSIDEEKGIATVKDEISGGTEEVPLDIITEGLLYRMYDPNRGEHFYTKNPEEAELLVQLGWQHESDSDFTVVSATEEDSTPVYRLYNPNFGGMHFYTTDANDAKYLESVGWNYEGICWRIA